MRLDQARSARLCTTWMGIRRGVASSSFMFPHPPEDEKTNEKQQGTCSYRWHFEFWDQKTSLEALLSSSPAINFALMPPPTASEEVAKVESLHILVRPHSCNYNYNYNYNAGMCRPDITAAYRPLEPLPELLVFIMLSSLCHQTSSQVRHTATGTKRSAR